MSSIDVVATIQALKDLAARKPETVVWADEDAWAIDALRGSLYNLKWRGTLTEYFIDNPGYLGAMVTAACERLRRLCEPKWPEIDNLLDGIDIGIGTYGWKYDPKVITQALGSGIGFIDTAETYGYGRVETAFGDIACNCTEDLPLIIATKVSRSHLSYDSIINAANRSMDRLRQDYIDLYQIHWPNPNYSIVCSMRAMKDLLEAEQIDAVGACNVSVDQLLSAQDALGQYRITSVQVRYNILDRGAERALIPYCQEMGIPVIAYSPLGQKFSRLTKSKGWPVMTEIASRCGITEAQVALAWIMEWDNVIPIPKTNNPEHAAEIAEVVDIYLDAQDVEWLDDTFPILE